MELYAALHPKPITVATKGKVKDLVTAINDQLGWPCLEAGPLNLDVDITAHEQPLWEILRQVNERSGVSFNYRTPKAIELTPTPVKGAGPMTVTDGVGVIPQVLASEGTTTSW